MSDYESVIIRPLNHIQHSENCRAVVKLVTGKRRRGQRGGGEVYAGINLKESVRDSEGICV